MAVRFRLSSLAISLIAIAIAMPATAQTKNSAAAAPQKPGVRADDCKLLPGGNAPINRVARLDTGISVRNLDLTYFGKPLFELTPHDYATLEALWPLCGTFDEATAPRIAEKLKSLVDDAKAVRQDSLNWINQTEREAKALKPGQEGIEKIHDFWQQMLNREFEMLESDMSYIAGVLSKRRDELYATAESRQRTLVSPFDPGPPEPRGLGGRGG